MVKLGYRSDVAVPLIRSSPLAFAVARTESGVGKLRKLGIPDEWILAILKAQKPAPPKRSPATARGSSALVGTWRATARQKGWQLTMIYRFTATGRFTAEGYRDGRKFATDGGTYKADGRVFTVNRSGRIFRLVYSLKGNQLIINLDNYGRLVFKRQR